MSLRILLFTALLTGCGTALAQSATDLSESSSLFYLRQHLYTLSADSMEGRNTAQEGQRKAAEYLVHTLKEIGIEPGVTDSNGHKTYLQPWDFVKRYGDRRAYYPQSWNVIGLLPATEPSDEYVVISGHYDHLGVLYDSIYNGADDNGSGTSSILEMARLFSKQETPRKRNLLFIFFSGEEKGLLGSKHYAKYPTVPLEQIVTDINIDMVGRADSIHAEDSNYVYVIGSDRISKRLDSLLQAANAGQDSLQLDYTYNDPDDPQRLYERSDHYNFASKGIPVVFFFSGIHYDYHKPADDVEKINFEVLYRRMMLAYRLASLLVCEPVPLLPD